MTHEERTTGGERSIGRASERGVVRRFLVAAFLLPAVSVMLSGCQFFQRQQDQLAQLPTMLPASPTIQDVIRVVNNNSSGIQTLSTNDGAITVQGAPTMPTTLAFERPYRFRLQSSARVLGSSLLDVGSNDELFWFWFAYNQSREYYYCRHDRFASGTAQQAIPVDPYRLLDAIGLVQLDPNATHAPPQLKPGGRLHIWEYQRSPAGLTAKCLILDARTGFVLEQYLYDANQQVVAGSSAGRPRRDPQTNLVVPSVVRVWTRGTGEGFSAQIELGNVRINQPIPNGAQLWAMPAYQGWTPVDLSNPVQQLAPASAPGFPPALPTAGTLPAATPPLPGMMPTTPPYSPPAASPPGTPLPGATAAPVTGIAPPPASYTPNG